MTAQSNTITMRHKMAAWRAMGVFRQPVFSRTTGQRLDSETESEESDSSVEYDTDLEQDSVKKNEIKEKRRKADAEIGVDMYRKVSETIYQAPQTRVIKNLSRETIDLRDRKLGASACTGLASALVKNTCITKLDLCGNNLSFEGGLDIATVLEENYHLVHVDLSNNELGNTGVAFYLGEMMRTNTGMLYLNLSSNGFNSEDSKHLATGIQFNDRIKDLDLSHNNIDEDGAKYVGKALGDNYALEKLNLSWNNIRRSGAVAVWNGLKYNENLLYLNLSDNGLAYEGALAMSECLKRNRSLREINVQNNRINWEGAEFIGGGLAENSTLNVIKLGSNPLTTTGTYDIIEALCQKKSGLKLLDLGKTPVIQNFEMIASSIKRMRPFDYIHGGVVPSHDILGSRHERAVDPMQRIIDYMHQKELRPIELLRSFDKDVKFKLTEDDFVERIKGTGIKLHSHEIEELMEYLQTRQSSNSTKNLNYKQLVEGVSDQVEKDRNLKIMKREWQKKRKDYHRRILNPSLPALTKSESSTRLMERPLSSLSTVSRSTQLSAASLLATFRSLNPLANAKNYAPDVKPAPIPNGKLKVNMSAPLGEPATKGKKKTTKKGKVKKRGGLNTSTQSDALPDISEPVDT